MSRIRSLGIAAALVAFATAAWFVGRSFLAEGEARAAAAAPAGPGAQPAAVEADSASVRPVSDASEAVTEPAAEPPTTQRAAAEPTAPEPGAGREILVVRADDGEPVPGARVRFVGMAKDDELDEHPAWDVGGGDAWLDEHGQAVTTDGEGRAWVAVPGAERAVLVGSAPGLWGRRYLRKLESKAPFRLKLAPDVSIEVLAVDAGGRGLADVPIALRERGSSWMNDGRVERTASDGSAVFAHIGPQLRADNDRRRSVALAGTFAEPVETPIDPENPPTEPVVLVVPPVGSLEVVVHPMPGGPPLEAGTVELMLYDPERGVVPSFWNRPDTIEADLVDGRALFTHVGLGLELALEARGESTTQPTRAHGAGPQAPGQEARLDVVLGSDHPVLRVRVHEADGEPSVNTELLASLEERSSMSRGDSGATIETDAEGFAWFDVGPFVGEDGELALLLQREPSDEAPGGRARIEVARELVDGLNDLGDVTLGAARLLAAGRVVAADGSPAARARVEVQAVQVGEGGHTWYDSLYRLREQTDEEGRFEIYGEVEVETLRLSAKADELVAEAVECAVGSSNVLLTLASAGRVTGRILLDESVDPGGLKVVMTPSGDDAQDWNARGRGEIEGDGAFAVAGLRPGSYDLTVEPDRTGTELVSIPLVVVASGQTTTDPRLDPIDLRGRLACFTLEVVPPKADDRITGIVVIRTPGAEEHETQFLHGPKTEICLTSTSADLEVLVQGFRSVELSGVREDTRVELEPGLRVRLRITGEVELPEPPRYLKAFLSSTEETVWSLGHFQEEVFDSRGEIVVNAGGPGTFEVSWLVEERRENSLTTSSLGVEESQTIEVLDVPGEQVFDVEIPRDAFEAWLKQRGH